MSEWLGDKQNGVEIRRHDDGTVDEVVVYINGQCVVHTEQISDYAVWMGIYTPAGDARVHFASRTGRAEVECGAEINP